jgi:AcrR family transcriptional regulator
MTGSRRSTRPRRRPRQQRAEQRLRAILEATAVLLERHGPDDLTTNRIAAELRMSVGTLYHYFPNKQAILYAMGADWLQKWQEAFDRIETIVPSCGSIEEFVDRAVDCMLEVYRGQRGIRHLVQALSAIPELRALDLRGDDDAARRLSDILRRLGMRARPAERERIARAYMKVGNALLPEIAQQDAAAARSNLADLKAMLCLLLERRVSRP